MEGLGFLVFIAIVVALIYLVQRSTKQPPREANLRAQLRSIHSMSGSEFERFMANVYKALGFDVRMLGGSGDQGVDLILHTGRESVAVQCKNHKRRVGNPPIQQVFAGQRHYRTTHAWVVAPAGFTKGAFDLSRTTGVRLFDYRGIEQWLRQIERQIEERRANEQRVREQQDERRIAEQRAKEQQVKEPWIQRVRRLLLGQQSEGQRSEKLEAIHDVPNNESQAKEQQNEEQRTRESQEKKEQQAREQQAREQQAKEQQAKEQQAKEQRAKEIQAKKELLLSSLQKTREQQAREQRAKEQQAKEQRAKELQAKKEQAREQRAKELQARNEQAREQRAKDRQYKKEKAKEQGTREEQRAEVTPSITLDVGDPATLPSGDKLTVYSYESPITTLASKTEEGYEFSAIDIEWCANPNAGDTLRQAVNSFDFYLHMPDNTRFRRGSRSIKMPALPTPPPYLDPGDCVRGWITIQTPKGAKPKFIIFSKEATVVKWAVP